MLTTDSSTESTTKESPAEESAAEEFHTIIKDTEMAKGWLVNSVKGSKLNVWHLLLKI